MAIQHIFMRSEDLIEPCKESICEKLSVKQLLFAVPSLIFSLNIFLDLLTGDMRFQTRK